MTNGQSVVVIGGGFGGVEVAKTLAKAGVPVTLIDRQNYHLFQPLLYQVATAGLSPADITEPIRKMLRGLPHAQMRMGEVTGIDQANKRVHIAGQDDVGYDHLVVATGATHSYFGQEQWSREAPGLKTIEDARLIRSSILIGFERAELASSPVEQEPLMTTVVIGGGPTGVELAGAAAELARHALARDFRRIRPELARIVLMEAGPRLLPTFSERSSIYAEKVLQRLGVRVLLSCPVRQLEGGRVSANGAVIAAGTILWAAGVAASPVGRWLGVETDRQGRVLVAPDNSVPQAKDIFVIGDAARMLDENENSLPGLAQVAKQQGHHLGLSLAAHIINGSPMPPFRYRNRGNAAIIGRNAAVFEFASGRRLSGRPAWLLWAVVHVWLLVGFENRILVVLQWIWRYLTYENGARLITTNPTAPNAARDHCES